MAESALYSEGEKSRPTMADVARIAGVTAGTVSRALAGSPLVKPKTRARIEEAVRTTRYAVNQAARNLRNNRSRQILVALPNIANPFFAKVVSGIEEAAQAANLGVLLGVTANRAEGELKIVQNLLAGAVDGLLLHTGYLPPELRSIKDLERKVVAVAHPIPDSRISCVGIDEANAAKEAVSHLIKMGHRRIAHLAGPPGINSTHRFRGYHDALLRSGIRNEVALVRDGDNTPESGRKAAAALLSLPKSPTAFFCANDEMAIGAIIACKELGLCVPDDISVVGFDDIEISALYDPPLTTIRQPRHEIGKVAMNELAALLEGRRKTVGRRIVLDHALVVRGSTKRIER